MEHAKSTARRMKSEESLQRSGKKTLSENSMQSLFEIEKARRDAIFRDKNAANFNIIGKKSYVKRYPIKRIKKVFFNDILSDQ